MKKQPLVSAVVTTKNEQDVISRLISSIKRQSYKRIELIVVDNDSSDDTSKIVKKMGAKLFNYGPERSAQRNYGVINSKGEYFLILDADMELQANVVNECVELISRSPKMGEIIIPEKSIGKNFWEKVKAFERAIYDKEGNEETDAARFFTREAFNKVGGFDETITGPEDWDFPESIKKAGFKVGRIKSYIYHYERIPSIWTLLKKKYYYALKSHRYLQKNDISIFSPKTIYLLRPVFYKNLSTLIKNPVLTIGMIVMLISEQVAGGLGYLVGKISNK